MNESISGSTPVGTQRGAVFVGEYQVKQIQKQVRAGKALREIAEEWETDEQELRSLYEQILKMGADCDAEEILRSMQESGL